MGETGPIPMDLPFRDLVSLAGGAEVPVWCDIESLLFQDSCLQGQMWVYAELYGLNPGQDFIEPWTNTDKGFFIYKGK